MFYCEKCRVANSWPETLSTSVGKCEICEETAVCFDMASKNLPPTKPPESVYNPLTDDHKLITLQVMLRGAELYFPHMVSEIEKEVEKAINDMSFEQKGNLLKVIK